MTFSDDPKSLSYVPQDVASDCLDVLTKTGFGKPGTANTLWAMVHEACAEVVRVRADRDRLLALVRSKHPVTAADDAAERLRDEMSIGRLTQQQGE